MLFSYNSLLCDKLINQENKVTWKLQFAITWHYQMQLKTILSHCYLIGISAGMNSPWNLGQIRWTWGLGQYAMRTPESFSWENEVTMVLFINRQMPLQWWWTQVVKKMFNSYLMIRTTRIATRKRVRAAPERIPRKGGKWRGTVWDSTWGDSGCNGEDDNCDGCGGGCDDDGGDCAGGGDDGNCDESGGAFLGHFVFWSILYFGAKCLLAKRDSPWCDLRRWKW